MVLFKNCDELLQVFSPQLYRDTRNHSSLYDEELMTMMKIDFFLYSSTASLASNSFLSFYSIVSILLVSWNSPIFPIEEAIFIIKYNIREIIFVTDKQTYYKYTEKTVYNEQSTWYGKFQKVNKLELRHDKLNIIHQK